MHAYETGAVPMELLEEWATLWGLPFFTDSDDLRTFLVETE
jgi:hypothetical protein